MSTAQNNIDAADGEQTAGMEPAATHPGAQKDPAKPSTSTTQAGPSPCLLPTVKRPRGTFHLFNCLPPELRAKIIQDAMVTPGIIYFKLTRAHFFPNRRSPHPYIRQTCNSTWRQHLALARTSPEFAHVVNLALTQHKNKRYLDSRNKFPFNKHDDLVVFSLDPLGSNWFGTHIQSPPGYIYTCFGHGLKRVGIKYDELSHRCAGVHEGGGEWGLESHANIAGRCNGPCRAYMCRYVSFFRDAEVVYLMVYIRKKSLPFRLTLERVASTLHQGQKETSLETWQDSAFTWVDVDSSAPAACTSAHAHRPWILAADLNRFVRDLPPHTKALVNPKMEFRVLVTMNRMRWNKQKLHR